QPGHGDRRGGCAKRRPKNPEHDPGARPGGHGGGRGRGPPPVWPVAPGAWGRTKPPPWPNPRGGANPSGGPALAPPPPPPPPAPAEARPVRPTDGLAPAELRVHEALLPRAGRPSEWVARESGVPLDRVRSVLPRLEQVGLAERCESGWRAVAALRTKHMPVGDRARYDAVLNTPMR